MKRSNRGIRRQVNSIVAFVVAAVAIAVTACFKSNGSLSPAGGAGLAIPFGRSYNYEDILVIRAVDGDTLELQNKERVRLIGMDTPEVHESEKLYRDARKTHQDVRTIQDMGRKAWAFTRTLVEGKRVRLVFDVEKRDRYGRLLAYVYLPDGLFVNAEIVNQGYASLLTIPPNVAHADELRRLYQEARESKRGLWAQ